MFSKRLAGMVPEARKYVAASVALQWVALAANIALMLLMGAFVQSLVEGGDVAASRANLVMAAAAVIVVRVCCLTLSQRMGQAAAAAAKRTVRKLVYDKLVRLGPSYSERVSMSEAVQVSAEAPSSWRATSVRTRPSCSIRSWLSTCSPVRSAVLSGSRGASGLRAAHTCVHRRRRRSRSARWLVLDATPTWARRSSRTCRASPRSRSTAPTPIATRR
ncbi:MAG: hypothetical protein ACLTMP_12425 [Eggerthella lenta]